LGLVTQRRELAGATVARAEEMAAMEREMEIAEFR